MLAQILKPGRIPDKETGQLWPDPNEVNIAEIGPAVKVKRRRKYELRKSS